MQHINLFLITTGGISMLIGLLGGSTELLSGNTPLWLAGVGVALMYLGVVFTGLIDLYHMDEKD